MYEDAEQRQAELEAKNEADGAIFKIKNDPRITPVGHFIRRWSIDELPQLINVLKGEMSLVGPRPLPLRDFERMSELHKRRLDRKSTRLNSSHANISYAVFCLNKN